MRTNRNGQKPSLLIYRRSWKAINYIPTNAVIVCIFCQCMKEDLVGETTNRCFAVSIGGPIQTFTPNSTLAAHRLDSVGFLKINLIGCLYCFVLGLVKVAFYIVWCLLKPRMLLNWKYLKTPNYYLKAVISWVKHWWRLSIRKIISQKNSATVSRASRYRHLSNSWLFLVSDESVTLHFSMYFRRRRPQFTDTFRRQQGKSDPFAPYFLATIDQFLPAVWEYITPFVKFCSNWNWNFFKGLCPT